MGNKFNPKLLMGAASMAAGMIKTLASSFRPRQKSWPEKTKNALHINRSLLLGTVAGGIIGVTTALLLAPERKKSEAKGGSRKKKAVSVAHNSEKKHKPARAPRKRKASAKSNVISA